MVKHIDLKVSDGPELLDGDEVEVFYRLALSDNDLNDDITIESTYNPDLSVKIIFSEETLLKGLFEGMKGMRSGGSIRKIYLPSALAYGDRDWKNIPKNTDLVVEICLARIKTRNVL